MEVWDVVVPSAMMASKSKGVGVLQIKNNSSFKAACTPQEAETSPLFG
jgi:hypothetical protein